MTNVLVPSDVLVDPPLPAQPSAVLRSGRRTDVVGVLRSEWIKLRSVRSTRLALVLLVVMALGFTALFTALAAAQWNTSSASDRARILADPTGYILGAGFELSQLVVCVLGVLVISAEYSSGTIHTSVLAVPLRTPMLAAKAVVFGAVVFVVAEIAAIPSFYLGAAILHSKVSVSITDPGVVRAILGAGMYGCVLGVFSIAVGALVRRTAGGISAVIGFVLVLAPLAQLLPGSIGKHVHAYLPTEAGHLIASSRQGTNDLLSPWQGFGVFSIWTIALFVLAGYLLKRRDA